MKKPIIILIAILILAVLGGGAYAFSKKAKTGSPVSSLVSKVASLNPSCKYNDPDLCKFINGWKDHKNYTVSSDITTKDGKKTTSVYKIDGEDKTQITTSESGKENYNFISLKSASYLKDYSDGKWAKTVYTDTKTDTTASTAKDSYSFDTKAEQVEDKTTYKKIGTEPCGKLTCFKYQVIDPANTDTTEYIYFDNKEYQLRKMRSEGKDGTIAESTFDYTKFTISEPSPVKDAPAAPALTVPAGSSSGVSSEDLKKAQDALKSLGTPAADPTNLPTQEYAPADTSTTTE